jgi:predicted nucleic acid-binding protein
MRVVLDTNVFVSGALKQGSTPGMAVLVVERHHVLLQAHATKERLFGGLSPALTLTG